MQPDKPDGILKDYQAGMNLALILMFSINRSVQIWSRVPGSTGSWFYGWLYFVGLGLQAWYYEVNGQATGYYDAIGWLTFAWFSVMWFGIHGVVRSFHFARGLRFHSYEPGRGIFDWMFPNWKPGSASLASDLAVSMALSIVLAIVRSPILSGWYAAMCLWLILAQVWIKASHSRRHQEWIDAKSEAERWSDQIQER